ncbi:MAG: hypothetical protein M0P12_10035 [Paludibacteraceae bacterium]|nr:hypothetical protein [Paludibacteraceae bacterium]
MKSHAFLLTMLLSLVSFSLVSCMEDEDKDKNDYYKEDFHDSNLPEYSENGLNLFGSEYKVNDEIFYFRSFADTAPCRIEIADSLLKFYMIGAQNKDFFSLCFEIIPEVPVSSFADLIKLEGKEFDVTSDSCKLKVLRDDEYVDVDSWYGYVRFVNAKNLYVDNQLFGTILSGRFGMYYGIDDDSIDISSGRFDFLIDDTNFIKKYS